MWLRAGAQGSQAWGCGPGSPKLGWGSESSFFRRLRLRPEQVDPPLLGVQVGMAVGMGDGDGGGVVS